MTQHAISVFNFMLRHFIASVVSIALPLALLTLIYVFLFVLAIVTNQGMGSPITLPIGLLILFAVCLIYTTTLLFPSVAIAELIASKMNKWKFPSQILFSMIVLAVLIFAFNLFWRMISDARLFAWAEWANQSLLIFGLLLIPLGIYWWTCKIIQAGIAVPLILLRKVRYRANIFS